MSGFISENEVVAERSEICSALGLRRVGVASSGRGYGGLCGGGVVPDRFRSGPSSAGFPPPIGSEIPSSMLAVDSKFEYGGQTYTVTFKGGIKQRIEEYPDDPLNSVRLRTVEFRMMSEIEEDGTLEQNDVDADARSTVMRTQQNPPRYEEKDFLDDAVTIDGPVKGPVVLHAKVLMILTAQLTQFPARGEMFHLHEPVEFVDPDNPDTGDGIGRAGSSAEGRPGRGLRLTAAAWYRDPAHSGIGHPVQRPGQRRSRAASSSGSEFRIWTCPSAPEGGSRVVAVQNP